MAVSAAEKYSELKEFFLQNITRTGISLGTGAYGDVEELSWNGTKCAGKRIHDSLLSVSSSSRNKICDRSVKIGALVR